MVKTVHVVLGSPENEALDFTPENNDRVIGVDSGALLVVENNLSLDLAIGDFDSVTKSQLQKIKEQAQQFKQFDAEKDDTDAEIALEYAENIYDPEEIIFYNWSGGRMDHLMNLLFLVYQPRFEDIIQKVVFKNTVNTIRFYKKGRYSLQKEKGKYYLAFIGMTALKGLTLKEVKYPVSHLNTQHPVTLVSNEMVNENCQFSFDEGVLAVIQSVK